MKRLVLISLCAVVTVVASIYSPSTILRAQTTFGVFVGTVTDQSQAAVPDATITVTNVATGIGRQAKSDQLGNYRVESLLPGVYRIVAEHAGFKSTQVSDTILPVAATITVNIQMHLGIVTEKVEVTALAPQIDTSTGTVGTVVNNTSVVTLPLNGRNFTDLLLTIPGSVGVGSYFNAVGGQNYSVSGNRADNNLFTIDGVYSNEEFFKQMGLQPSIDAIQEFRVQTNVTSAEYGQGAGANVNVAIKSGTNQIHGSAFEFVRNSSLDANDWFRNYANLPKPQYQRNQYGGVIGGPLVIPKVYDGRDRTFWLFNYEGFKVRRGSTINSYIPTAAQFNGDLTGQPPVFDPALTQQTGTDAAGNPIYTSQQISCNGQLNVICPDRINSFVKNYDQVMYPMVTAAPGAGFAKIVNVTPTATNDYQWTTRVDHKIRENLMFFSRFSMANASIITPDALPVLTNSTTNNYRNVVASWTYLASPTTVLDFKLGYNRSNLQIADSNPAPGWPAFLDANPIQGTPVKSTRVPLFPMLLMSGFNGPSQTGYPFPTNEYQAVGSISKIKGAHSIKAGAELVDMRNLDDGLYTSEFVFYSTPTADPQNLSTTGSALASYLLGLPYVGVRNVGDTAAHMRQARWAVYLQDDIKVSRKLTLNLGLRYEYDQWPVEAQNRISALEGATGALLWAGQNPVTGQGPNTRRSINDPDFNNFAPRVGMAYAIDSKTSFRGGYGIFYVTNGLWEAQGPRGQWPYAISEVIVGTNTPGPVSALKPLQTYFSPQINPGPGTPPSTAQATVAHQRTGYMQQWNAGVQRQLPHNLMVEVDYVGNHGVKLSYDGNFNNALPGPGVVGTPEHPRQYNQYGALSLSTTSASSNYNALQVKVEKRFSNGLQFLTSYSWANEIDLGSGCFACSASPQNEYNPAADRGPGAFDMRHIFTTSYSYELPFGRGKRFLGGANGVANQVVGGWQITGITHYNTGLPLNVVLGSNNANDGAARLVQRPDLVGTASRLPRGPDVTQGWLNPAAFAVPAPYTYGNLGRNAVRAPGMGNWDFGLFKNFTLHNEAMTLQFRAELFNAFNHMNPGAYGTTLGAPTFGVVSGTQTYSREIQLALKLLF